MKIENKKIDTFLMLIKHEIHADQLDVIDRNFIKHPKIPPQTTKKIKTIPLISHFTNIA